MITARSLAYQILLHLNRQGSYPDRLIRVVLGRHSQMDERDRALLTELVYGVMRWQGRLDWHLDQLSHIKPQKMDPAVRVLLRLALYQLLFLDRIPAHAAVNETVNIAKGSQPLHLVRFVNAILRTAVRRQGAWQWPTAEADPESYLAIMTSHPSWFVRRVLQEKGFAEAEQLCQANNRIAPMTLRVNFLQTSSAEVLHCLAQLGIEVQGSAYLAEALRLAGLRHDITQTAPYRQGWIQVQDEASQMIAHLLAPEPGTRVLDLCAGFGGKSTHLAVLMANRGEILAVDKSAWKLEELQANAQRQRVGIIEPLPQNALEVLAGQVGDFDRVLLDAPCSGFGVLRRNPDIKWRRHPKDPHRFARMQQELLRHAAGLVRRDGVMVYATCTMFAEENDAVVKQFLQEHPRWALEPAADFLPAACRELTDGVFFQSWPHRHDIDGFFGARLRRRE